MKKYLLQVLKLLSGGVVGVFLIQLRFVLSTRSQIVSVELADSAYDIGLVLGASVYENGTPSPILKDRLDTAVELYEGGIIDRILVSGDNAQVDYNEVHGMSNYLQEEGVPAADIFQDYAGFDTYDSMYRAREIFQVQKMIVITQQFHLPRAIAIANSLGLQTQGVIADSHRYTGIGKIQLREIAARIKAFGEIVFGSEAKFGGEEISIEGESNTLNKY